MISCGKPYQLSQSFKEFSIATICIWTKESILDILNYIDCIEHRPIHRPLFVLGMKRPIHYVASVELPPSIATIMYGK